MSSEASGLESLMVVCGKTSVGQTKLNIYCVSFRNDLQFLLQTIELTSEIKGK
jgi:hypothetical protein